MNRFFILLVICLFAIAAFGQEPTVDNEILSEVRKMSQQMEMLDQKVEDNNPFWIGLITAIATLLTLIVGIYQYSSKKNEDFKKTIWEERKKLYMEVLGHASRIAISEDIDAPETKAYRQGFWALYWGRLCVLEDKEVLTAMIEYGDQLEHVEQHEIPLKDADLENLSYLLAEACRNSLIRTWQPVKFQNLGHIARNSMTNEKIQDSEEEEKKVL